MKPLHKLFSRRIYTRHIGPISFKWRGGFSDIRRRPLSKEKQFLVDLQIGGQTVYDIGGFRGATALFFSKKTTGQVVVFEPNPHNYVAILDHIALNRAENITPLNIGIGSTSVAIYFNDDAARSSAVKGQGGAGFWALVASLDEVVECFNLPYPHIIKIDVEGMELGVLEGMKGIIADYGPSLFIELHNVKQAEVVRFLLERDYTVYNVEQDIFVDTPDVEVRGHLWAT